MKTLSPSEVENLPSCPWDWMKHKCDFKVMENKAPTHKDCLQCFLCAMVQALSKEDIAMATHITDELEAFLKTATIKEGGE